MDPIDLRQLLGGVIFSVRVSPEATIQTDY